MNICVYGAASSTIEKVYIKAGETLGREMARRGIGLVFGAGANGMMGAAARGVSAGNGKIIGIAPKFFNVDGILYDKCDELLRPDTMRERKALLEGLADGFIVTAGGIGTFDELFEFLTLKQLGQHDKPIVILNTAGYYDEILAMLDTAVKKNFVGPAVSELFFVTDSVKRAITYIQKYRGKDFDFKKYKNV